MKRSSWVLLLLLVIVIGIYLLIRYRGENTPTVSTDEPVTDSFLIQEVDSTLTGFRIFNNAYQIVALVRNSEGFWEMTQPTKGMADQSRVSEIESQIKALAVSSKIGQVTSLGDFGLAQPFYTILLTYTNEVKYLITVGNSTPTGSGYYIQVNNKDVFVVNKYSLDAILSVLTTPPYPATVTPTSTLELPIITSTEVDTSESPPAVQSTP